jgi:hypothetical protein
MLTHGRILHSLVAVSLSAAVVAWTGLAGNDGAAAADLPPPIVTKAVLFGVAPKQAVPHGTSATAEAKPVRLGSGNGTAARRPNTAAGQEPHKELSKPNNNAPAEAAKPPMLPAQSSDLTTTAQGASPQQQNVGSQREPAASPVIGSNSSSQGEAQPATSTKSALLSTAPPTGAPPPASEAKIEPTTPPGPADNQASVPQLPDQTAPSPSPIPPAVGGKTEAPASEPPAKTEFGVASGLPDTASYKPDALASPPDSGALRGAPNPSPHQPQMAEDQAPAIASPPNPTPSVPLGETSPAPPPAGPKSPPPEKPFPLGLGVAAAVVVLLIAGLIAFFFAP